MIRITDLKLELNQAMHEAMEIASLKQLIIKQYRLNPLEIRSFSLFKKAIDARKKDHIVIVYSVDIELDHENLLLERKLPGISLAPDMTYQDVPFGEKHLKHRPVIIGFGPSGIFAALILAKRGYRPIVLERGLDVDRRSEHVDQFYETGQFSEHSTILFGEGGAGTFSDGKLTTLINDLRCRFVLEQLVKAGAPSDIMYVNRPHVGTDILKGVIKKIRHEIEQLGGEIRFDHKVTGFKVEHQELKALIINHHEELEADVCLMGIGHSARDTFEVLYDVGMHMIQKPFSIGVRIEHPQEVINRAQYGVYFNHPALGAADYKLAYHSSSGRSAYTFCMCPGGWVMCSSSEPGHVVTNGMSERKRDHFNANSALLVGITPADFDSDHPLAGVHFQRRLEKKAFELAGQSYFAPVQRVEDFLNDRVTQALGHVSPTYRPGVSFVKMTDLLPKYVTDTMKEALLDFNRKLKGFSMGDAILTGVETRSSSPVRMMRSETFESSIKGLHPMGEGAGYAGGIMSSSVDGMKTAESIIQRYQPKQL
jgi:uncharacterized protein